MYQIWLESELSLTKYGHTWGNKGIMLEMKPQQQQQQQQQEEEDSEKSDF